LHESGHVLAARVLGLKVSSVQISGAGGFCRVDRPRRASHIFVLYSAGLLAQAVLVVGAIVYLGLVGAPSNKLGRALLESFTVVNLVMIVLNVIPFRDRGGIGTDGRVLWLLFRHAMWGDAHPLPWIDLLPGDQAPVFPPETHLLSIPELVPNRFDQGVEILNDRTTPMDFVVTTLARNLDRTREEAIQWMATIHNKGGILIRLPTLERAEKVARAITADSVAAGHSLVCRAVDARAVAGVRGIL
jgi:ATP-dependent Clp protease adapter protein ClpS